MEAVVTSPAKKTTPASAVRASLLHPSNSEHRSTDIVIKYRYASINIYALFTATPAKFHPLCSGILAAIDLR